MFTLTCTKFEGPELESPFLSSSPILLIYIRNELHFISGYWQITDDGVLWCRASVSRYVLPTQM